ncbi:hypothetical protein R1flu_022171 [Riccia fluitans]|uniref:Uncharacterized protein n=1 Tax=Riccia fluitans TaxID=41844 RepID=A0ABD1ZRF2_9MARC
MASRRSKNLKTKEVKIPHLTISNRKKMETWGVGGLFAVDWSGTYDNLVEELVTKPKAAGLKFEYRGKLEEWTLEVWREVYNLPKASPGAITNSDAPTPDWGEAVKKTMARQIKSLGVCNEATCLGPYLAHLYTHFHEMDQQEEASKKRKASIQTVSDSNTETKPEEKKESPKEIPRVICEDEASGSKPLDLKVDFVEWGNRVESFSRETFRLFEAFHIEIGSVIAEAVAWNLTKMFAPPPVVETDLQPWKEMVSTLVDLLAEEQKRIKLVVEQRDYFEGKNRCSEKIPEIALWPQGARRRQFNG